MQRTLLLRACAFLLLAPLAASAQDETDALRYSHLQPQGTARSLGFGSALGSVGGDFSSLTVNPAGIGIYRRSELTITPSFRINGVEGTYLGNTTDDDAFRFNVSNFGIVSTRAPKGSRYDKAAWKSVSFGFGISRVADFNRRYTYNGLNDSSSASERFAIDANDQFFSQGFLDEGTLGDLGYQAYLLDTAGGQYFTNVNWQRGLNQTRSVQEWGGINEAVISLGGNYQERLLLGATLGLPILRYQRESVLQESDATNTIDSFENFSFTENLRTRGVGVNLKLGAIYKFSDQFRLGAAFHTPTRFSLRDEQELRLTSNTEGYGENGNGIHDVVAPLNTFEYSLTTPWRAVLSGTVILNKMGFLTVDYEYVDYSTARYRFNTNTNQSLFGPGYFADYEQEANDRIRSTYQAASNIRAGFEFLLDGLALRAGAGYYGNPYRNSNDFDPARVDVSAGIGFRFENAFIDLAYVHSRFENSEQPYTLPYAPPTVVTVPSATLANRLNNVAITLGFKF